MLPERGIWLVSETPDVGEVEPEKPVSRRSKRVVVTAIIAVVIVVVLVLTVLMSPSYSPLASVHDADGDGVADSDDEFPDDPDEWLDTDDDGHGDNSDEFPDDPEEWEDTDGDGCGDNGDAFPTDPNEWLDSDGDGVGDNADAFPMDSTQWADRDGDGYGDNPLGLNPDAFPDDPTEWRDSDSDGVGDNADFYDSGNGKIEISVDRYQGDGTADFWTYGDPFFIVRVDVDNDGDFDLEFTSAIFSDTELLTSPYSVVVDLAEDTGIFRFAILVYDSDLEGNYIIDYCPTTNGDYYVHTITAPDFAGEWSYNGSDDGLSETDCILDYSLSVTS